MRLLRFALPAVLALSVVAGTAAAADRDAFLDCVARNTVKYSEPGSSAVAQYVDVEAACRSALDDGPEAGFVIVDADGDRVGGGGTASGSGDASADAASGGSASTTPSQDGQGPEGSTASAPAGGASPPGGGGTSAGGGAGAAKGSGAAANAGPAPAVASLPASAESVEPLSGTPGWLLALVALGIVAVVATAGLETYRRRRG